MIRTVTAAVLAAASLALPVAAMETLKSQYSVTETMDRLEVAVEGAGATVVGRVDHTSAASGIDMDLPQAQLLIFGNPAVGTPIMQEDLRAGLILPLRVLVYEEDGGTVVAYQTPEEMFAGLDIDLRSEPVMNMRRALAKLTALAVE